MHRAVLCNFPVKTRAVYAELANPIAFSMCAPALSRLQSPEKLNVSPVLALGLKIYAVFTVWESFDAKKKGYKNCLEVRRTFILQLRSSKDPFVHLDSR